MQDLPPTHRITVDEYHRMGELGFFAPDARVELIDGQIIDMPPIGSRHQAAVDRLTELLFHAVAGRAIVRTQGSVVIEEFSEPQPDIVLLKRREDFYSSRRATAADTLLIIEVSDTTWRYDRHVKAPLYARCGIPELWIVDLQGCELHSLREPSSAGYAQTASTRSPGAMPIQELGGASVELSNLLQG